MNTGSRKRPSMYGLSTCGWCAKARAWLDGNADGYDLVYVDLLNEEERSRVMEELRSFSNQVAFPMVFFGDKFVIGYKPEEYQRLTEHTE